MIIQGIQLTTKPTFVEICNTYPTRLLVPETNDAGFLQGNSERGLIPVSPRSSCGSSKTKVLSTKFFYGILTMPCCTKQVVEFVGFTLVSLAI